MSWLFAAVADDLTPEQQERFRSIHSPPLQSVITESLYVAIGGLEETTRFRADGASGFAVVGTGIRLREGFCEFLTTDEWGRVLTGSPPNLSQLDGHFLALRWEGKTLEAWTDQIGLRTVYAARYSHGYVLSTRLDWVAKVSGCSEIDFDQLGSSWLLTNQMAYNSAVKGVSRLGPGGTLMCTPHTLRIQSKPWTPDFETDSTASMMRPLQSLVAPRVEPPRILSLGLSGGFDCRVLLALLLKRQTPFGLHSFGHPDDPDVVMARRIAEGESLSHVVLTSTPEDVPSFIRRLHDYVAQVGIVAPASLLLKVRYYSELHQQHRMLIDGGYGEISRRQMGNRLLRKGPALLRRGKPEELFRLLSSPRPPIFLPEVERRMVAGAKQELADVWSAMPPAKDIGAENFVDLLSIRARVANNGAPAQQWIDGQVVNYMPYAQPSFLREIFRTPLAARRNSRLHRRVLRESAPTLARYPLVKEGVVYPYGLTTVPAWLWRTVASKVGKKWIDDSAHAFLMHIREFVRDTVHSQVVKGFVYDEEKVVRNVERYYAGERRLAKEVDWWLTFELWRRSLLV